MKTCIASRYSFFICLAPWIFLIPLLSACQKEETRRLPEQTHIVEEAVQAIVGTWEWEKTSIKYRGMEATYKTPETENKTIQYVFRKNGTAVKIENKSDSTEYNFEIKSISDASGDFGITFSPLDQNMVPSSIYLIFFDDKMILTNRLGTSIYYIRK